MKINYKNWLLTAYICSLLYIGSAYHYLVVQRYNFLLAVVIAVLVILVLSLIIHWQNKKILLLTALVVTLSYIGLNATLLFAA